jgi:hypothetical protein
MAYSDFTLTQLRERFGLQVASVSGSFESIAPIAPSEFLKTTLERGMPIAVGRGREKARSEALVLPVLLEVRAICDQKISVFSGIEFNLYGSDSSGLAPFTGFGASGRRQGCRFSEALVSGILCA